MTFREWMIQKHIKGEPFTIDELLAKYDELEPGPKFKVGDEVMFGKEKFEVAGVVTLINEPDLFVEVDE